MCYKKVEYNKMEIKEDEKFPSTFKMIITAPLVITWMGVMAITIVILHILIFLAWLLIQLPNDFYKKLKGKFQNE